MRLLVFFLLITESSFSHRQDRLISHDKSHYKPTKEISHVKREEGIKSEELTIQQKDSNECGVKSTTRIVGGTTATLNEYPWIAVLCSTSPCNSDSQFCGGSLIKDQFILTAAHCVAIRVAKLMVSLGDHDISSTTETISVEIQAEQIIIHTDYNSITMRNDIALVKLKTKVTLSDKIGLICLPPATPTYDKETAYVAGWGTTSQDGKSAKILREVSVTVMSNEDCQKKYIEEDIFSTMLCAWSPGKDSCQGDSGGPLIFKTDAGVSLLIGIVSWGIGCASKKYPGVYTRVNKYLNWIETNTQATSVTKQPTYRPWKRKYYWK